MSIHSAHVLERGLPSPSDAPVAFVDFGTSTAIMATGTSTAIMATGTATSGVALDQGSISVSGWRTQPLAPPRRHHPCSFVYAYSYTPVSAITTSTNSHTRDTRWFASHSRRQRVVISHGGSWLHSCTGLASAQTQRSPPPPYQRQPSSHPAQQSKTIWSSHRRGAAPGSARSSIQGEGVRVRLVSVPRLDFRGQRGHVRTGSTTIVMGIDDQDDRDQNDEEINRQLKENMERMIQSRGRRAKIGLTDQMQGSTSKQQKYSQVSSTQKSKNSMTDTDTDGSDTDMGVVDSNAHTSKLQNSARDLAQDIQKKVQQSLKDPVKAVEELSDAVQRGLNNPQKAAENILDVVEDVVEQGLKTVEELRQATERNLEDPKKAAQEIGDALEDAVQKGLKTAGDVRQGVERGLDDPPITKISEVRNTVEDAVEKGFKTMNQVGKAVEQSLEEPKKVVDEVRDAVENAVEQGFVQYQNTREEFEQTLEQGLEDPLKVAENIRGAVENAVEKGLANPQQSANEFINAVQRGFAEPQRVVQDIKNAVKQDLTDQTMAGSVHFQSQQPSVKKAPDLRINQILSSGLSDFDSKSSSEPEPQTLFKASRSPWNPTSLDGNGSDQVESKGWEKVAEFRKVPVNITSFSRDLKQSGEELGRVSTYCVAQEYRMTAMRRALAHKPGLEIDIIDNVIHAYDSDHPQQDVFVFPYGVVVIWGMEDETEEESVLSTLKAFEKRGFPSSVVASDTFSFKYGSSFRMVNEVITMVPRRPDETIADFLSNDDTMILTSSQNKSNRSDSRLLESLDRLAVSHALAQSVKLITFEESVQNTISDTRHLPEELALNGSISATRLDISKNMGRLIMDNHNVYLYADVLDTPEFLWEYELFEPPYRVVERYLELRQRGERLNRRVEVVRELFNLLSNELQFKHNSDLEIIIIILIAFEISITLAHDFVKVFFNKKKTKMIAKSTAATTSAIVPKAAAAGSSVFLGVAIGLGLAMVAYFVWNRYSTRITKKFNRIQPKMEPLTSDLKEHWRQVKSKSRTIQPHVKSWLEKLKEWNPLKVENKQIE